MQPLERQIKVPNQSVHHIYYTKLSKSAVSKSKRITNAAIRNRTTARHYLSQSAPNDKRRLLFNLRCKDVKLHQTTDIIIHVLAFHKFSSSFTITLKVTNVMTSLTER